MVLKFGLMVVHNLGLLQSNFGVLAPGLGLLGIVPQVLLHCKHPGRDIGHWGLLDSVVLRVLT